MIEYSDQLADDLGRGDERSALDILKDWRTTSENEDRLLAALMLAEAEADERTRNRMAETLLGQL